jgi:acetylornithine deacetylase/succinyl-diaminopimelate desuccinylase-like protein
MFRAVTIARSASDAKGPVAMFLTALDAMNAQGLAPNFNLKIIMDFEEEPGSPHLPAAVRDNRELLAADMLIIFDGPRHISNRPTLYAAADGHHGRHRRVCPGDAPRRGAQKP